MEQNQVVSDTAGAGKHEDVPRGPPSKKRVMEPQVKHKLRALKEKKLRLQAESTAVGSLLALTGSDVSDQQSDDEGQEAHQAQQQPAIASTARQSEEQRAPAAAHTHSHAQSHAQSHPQSHAVAPAQVAQQQLLAQQEVDDMGAGANADDGEVSRNTKAKRRSRIYKYVADYAAGNKEDTVIFMVDGGPNSSFRWIISGPKLKPAGTAQIRQSLLALLHSLDAVEGPPMRLERELKREQRPPSEVGSASKSRLGEPQEMTAAETAEAAAAANMAMRNMQNQLALAAAAQAQVVQQAQQAAAAAGIKTEGGGAPRAGEDAAAAARRQLQAAGATAANNTVLTQEQLQLAAMVRAGMINPGMLAGAGLMQLGTGGMLQAGMPLFGYPALYTLPLYNYTAAVASAAEAGKAGSGAAAAGEGEGEEGAEGEGEGEAEDAAEGEGAEGAAAHDPAGLGAGDAMDATNAVVGPFPELHVAELHP